MLSTSTTPLAEAARQLGVHCATLMRWSQRGTLGSDGQRHTLRLQRVGGRWRGAQSDIDAFLSELNSRGKGESPPRTRRADAHVERELDRILGPV